MNKICLLDLPHSIVNWIIDYLSSRYQRVKLSSSCYLEWGAVPSGVPKGTKLGPYLFLIIINIVEVHESSLWKFVDDTTAAEIVAKGQLSSAQAIADKVVGRSNRNRLQLNPDKCKELRISFSKQSPDFTLVQVDNKSLEVVKQAKLLGLTFDNKLSWNSHIENIVKKASKRLYFLSQLNRAKIPTADLVLFCITCVDR